MTTATTEPPKRHSIPRITNGLGGAGIRTGGLKVTADGIREDSNLTIVLMGGKDSGKSCAPALIPVKTGQRKVYISCDDTTVESLRSRYGLDWLDGNIEVYELTRRVVMNGKETYAGYDPNRPETSEQVIGNIMLLLDQLEQEANVGLLVIDHWQALYEDIGISYARHVNKLGPTDEMRFDHYAPRASAMKLINQKAKRSLAPGGKLVITGYSPEEKLSYTEVPDPRNPGKTKKEVIKKMVDPKWLKDDIKRDYLVVLKAEQVRTTDSLNAKEGKATDKYLCEVVSSKVGDRFPKGVTKDITGRGLDVFWDVDAKTEEVKELLAQ